MAAGKLESFPVYINDWIISDFLKFIEKKEEEFFEGPRFEIERRLFGLGFRFNSEEIGIFLLNYSEKPFQMGFWSLSLISKDGTRETICARDLNFQTSVHEKGVPGTTFINK